MEKIVRLFDTHAHLCDEQLWEQRAKICESMTERGVQAVMNICTNELELNQGLKLIDEINQPKTSCLELGKEELLIGACAATGPNEVEQQGQIFFPAVAKAAANGQLWAIGETRLDYHWNSSSVQSQKYWFIRYIELALLYQLPLIIHCREAFEDIIDVLDQHYVGQPGAKGGIFHCFAQDFESAQEVIKRGFLVSFSGIITYNSARNVQQVAQLINDEDYVIETDSPYLYPGKKRSTINEPANVYLVAQKVSELRGQSLAHVAQCSWSNAIKILQVQ